MKKQKRTNPDGRNIIKAARFSNAEALELQRLAYAYAGGNVSKYLRLAALKLIKTQKP